MFKNMRHPSIPKVESCFFDRQHFYFILPFSDGQTLGSFIKKNLNKKNFNKIDVTDCLRFS